jgi:hypothetical protein
VTARGLVVYRGASVLDGGPVFVVVTLSAGNRKIGDMAQAWVMRSDLPPRDAIATGLDRSVCGACVHRSGAVTGRSCYVATQLGPTTIFKSFVAWQYPDRAPIVAGAMLGGRQLRITAYGDPAAVPFEVWDDLTTCVSGWTGYTQQWRTCDPRFRSVCMASAASAADVAEARALGWRTYRTRTADDALLTGEVVCPASREAGHAATCDTCGLCRGTARDGVKSIAIVAHGQRAAWFQERKSA